jgi:2-hydroxycyclohexanecarboxyl-CoA dehydrogenase
VPVALVIGGSGGLGSAVCAALAAGGHDVALTYRHRAVAAKRVAEAVRAKGVHATCVRLDLGEMAEVERAFDRAAAMGPLDTVVYASGPPIPQRWFSRVLPADWSANVGAEIEGFFNLAHVALPRLRQAGRAAFVATTSFATDRVIPGDVLSAVPKAAIEMLMRQVAREEGRYGIRANCVSPGIIDAGLGARTQADHYTPEIWDRQRRAVPLGGFGTAQAIADAVAFLASDNASYITGRTIVVDGGLSL